jgi:hypothetical protein
MPVADTLDPSPYPSLARAESADGDRGRSRFGGRGDDVDFLSAGTET